MTANATTDGIGRTPRGVVRRAPGPAEWCARLSFDVERRGSRSALTDLRHSGPLRVQRAFHPESNGACHIYVLHPPGGVAGGDRLELDVRVRPGARALLTTPSAQKLYRCPTLPSRQHVRLRVDSGCLEWLPQETIAFEDAHAQLDLDVDLDRHARLIAWDLVSLGRPARGEGFERGSLDQRIRVTRAGAPLWSERLHIAPSSALASAAWGLSGCSTFATLIATPASPGLTEAVRTSVQLRPGERFGVSQPRGAIVCRYLGAGAQRAHEVMASAWNVLRPAVVGAPAVPPRIWAT